MRPSKMILIILLVVPIPCFSLTYTCNVLKKIGFDHLYSEEDLAKFSPFTQLEISDGNIAYISRCVYFNKKLQCKKMLVDKIVRDDNVNLIKFYVFDPQYNFQLFHNLSALEDNGRGDISYEKCTID